MANIKDVAKAAGLSVGTVSRIFNNRGYISDSARKKVANAMKELNYVPNELAKSIFRQYTKIIGVIVPAISHPYFGKLAEALETYAADQGYKIMLCNSFYQPQKETEYFQMLRGNQVDGIVLASRDLDVGDALNDHLPLITVDRILDNNVPCISSDNYQGGMLAAQHLLHCGCTRLAYIGGPPSLHLMANLRGDGFVETCHKARLQPVLVSTSEQNFMKMDYCENIRRLFAEHPDLDGIFASSDIIAAQVLRVAAAAGIRVPEQLKVIGYDDINLAELTCPSITTVHQPIEQISKYALDFLLDEIHGNIAPLRTTLPVNLVIRESA